MVDGRFPFLLTCICINCRSGDHPMSRWSERDAFGWSLSLLRPANVPAVWEERLRVTASQCFSNLREAPSGDCNILVAWKRMPLWRYIRLTSGNGYHHSYGDRGMFNCTDSRKYSWFRPPDGNYHTRQGRWCSPSYLFLSMESTSCLQQILLLQKLNTSIWP